MVVIDVIEASEKTAIVSVSVAIQKLMILFTFAATACERKDEEEKNP